MKILLLNLCLAMTLSDATYQKMRDMAIHMMRSIGDFARHLIYLASGIRSMKK